MFTQAQMKLREWKHANNVGSSQSGNFANIHLNGHIVVAADSLGSVSIFLSFEAIFNDNSRMYV